MFYLFVCLPWAGWEEARQMDIVSVVPVAVVCCSHNRAHS
jgi:hypothetical protein